MILPFLDEGSEDIFNGEDTKRARNVCPQILWKVPRRKLDQINAVEELSELNAPPGNRLEGLKGERRGQQSIRINQQYRICFVWTADGPDRVEIADYH